MRKKIIAGNWKMNKTNSEAIQLVKMIKIKVTDIKKIDMVVCPPFTALSSVNDIVRDSNLKLGAQNLFWEEKGAYTGEISVNMILSTGCSYVIIGHSERRQYFGETDETVNKKIKTALKSGLLPIVCIGETLEQREKGITQEIIDRQIRGGFSGLTSSDISKIIIAYEPVWAIGTGRNATPEQAQEVHSFIRKVLSQMYDKNLSENLRIQYGGSVNTKNSRDLLSQPDIDGALVGGASLEADSFVDIIKSCE
jgi:triosephosphate isomerase